MILTDKRYVSEIEGFKMPNGILNKVIPGCGLTEFAITNDEPTIILSPRLGLMESKCNQHPELLRVAQGVTVADVKNFTGKKIISTYDSFYKIKEALGDKIKDYRILVDEMQNIVKDAAFKSETLRNMVELFKGLEKVTYVSATPLLDIFKKIPAFKDLEYTQIEWTKYTERIPLNIKAAASPLLEATKLARAYANGVMKEGTDSIIFFVNSIEGICHIIRKAGLTPENTNVLIADTERNKQKLRKTGFHRGTLPNKGEAYKPVTLCTSAYIAGADFYNKAAEIYVICDVYKTKPFSIVDELPQACGRTRLGNKGCYLIYKAGQSQELDIDEKRKRTAMLVEKYNSAEDIFKNDRKELIDAKNKIGQPSEDDYLVYDFKNEVFIEDEFALAADMYARQIIETYKYGTLIFKEASKEFNVSKLDKSTEKEVKGEGLKRDRGFETAMKEYLETTDAFKKQMILVEYPQMIEYENKLGATRIKALGCIEANIRKFISNEAPDVKNEVYNTFFKVSQMTVKEAKEKLQAIYTSKHITRTAKAAEIVAMYPDYFEIKQVFLSGKNVKCLVRKK